MIVEFLILFIATCFGILGVEEIITLREIEFEYEKCNMGLLFVYIIAANFLSCIGVYILFIDYHFGNSRCMNRQFAQQPYKCMKGIDRMSILCITFCQVFGSVCTLIIDVRISHISECYTYMTSNQTNYNYHVAQDIIGLVAVFVALIHIIIVIHECSMRPKYGNIDELPEHSTGRNPLADIYTIEESRSSINEIKEEPITVNDPVEIELQKKVKL